MNKLAVLTANELTKISRRVSIIVILAITFVGSLLIGLGVMTVTNFFLSEEFSSDMTEYFEEDIKQAKADIAVIDQKLAEPEENLYPGDIAELQNKKCDLLYNIGVLEMELESGLAVEPNDVPYFIYDVISTLSRAENYPASMSYTPSEADLKELRRIYSEKDFHGWIGYQKEHIRYEYDSEEEAKIQIDMLSLREKADPTGQGEFSDEIDYITSCRFSLLNNRSMDMGRPLSADERREYEDSIAVTAYYVENAIHSATTGSMALEVMDSFGISMVTLLTIILAGGSVSGELSTGSIKSLIIAPVKRRKIYLSKVLALVITGLAAILAVCIFNSVAGLIICGDNALTPYVYAVNGQARVISAPVYRILYAVTGYADIMAFTFFAFMLSVVTRNTATAVGVSMAVYFGGGILSELLMIFENDVLNIVAKFTPSQNLDIAAKVFSRIPIVSGGMDGLFGAALTNGNSVAFSLCYLAAASACMLLTAFDSFTKRDI